jgi:Ca2+-binding EF-hand superfamily protein
MDGETDKERDERLEKLWNTLDTGGDGQIDINGLKKGLKKMDHRMVACMCEELEANPGYSSQKCRRAPP